MFDPSFILKSTKPSAILDNPSSAATSSSSNKDDGRSDTPSTTVNVIDANEWSEVTYGDDGIEEPPRGRRRASKELPHLSSNPSSPVLGARSSLSQSPPSVSILTPPNGYTIRPPSPTWYHRSQPLLNLNHKLLPVALSAPTFQAHHTLPPIPVVPSETALSTTSGYKADLPSDPILYLPPLLSRLPAWIEPHNIDNPKLAPPHELANFETRLPDIDPGSLALHQALHFFQPIDTDYAATRYDEAFNWSQLVSFRLIVWRRSGC